MLYALVLAAGQSSRFGRNKLLANVSSGLPMIVQSVKNLEDSVDHVYAVIRPDDKKLMRQLHNYGIKMLFSENAHLGMGVTIADAVRQTQTEADAWQIALGDMPFVKPSTVDKLVSQYHKHQNIVVPSCDGRRGHPVIFPSQYANALMNLDGDRGARLVIDQNLPRVDFVAVDDVGILRDIDYPEDLESVVIGKEFFRV